MIIEELLDQINDLIGLCLSTVMYFTLKINLTPFYSQNRVCVFEVIEFNNFIGTPHILPTNFFPVISKVHILPLDNRFQMVTSNPELLNVTIIIFLF